MQVSNVRSLFFPLLIVCFFNGISNGQGGGGVEAAQPGFKVVRSVSGSKGSQQAGHFVMEDPRSVFYVPEDKQVVIYFEWEGPVRAHHLEAFWKNPAGKTVVFNDFDYKAQLPRFGAYWTLMLSDTTEPGIWTLEAHVDGELAGTHSFEITTGKGSAVAITPAKKFLNPSELYKLAIASTVTIEKLDNNGERVSLESGFVLRDGLVVTAFQSIDGASSLHIIDPNGHSQTVTGVAAWNRWQDWAVLRADTSGIPALHRAPPDSWAVGDRSFGLDFQPEGGRTLRDISITGTNHHPLGGDRVSISYSGGPSVAGGALFNEYGEVIGILGGSVFPGGALMTVNGFPFPANLMNVYNAIQGTQATPIKLVPEEIKEDPTPLSKLFETGEFTQPLKDFRNIAHGSIAKSVDNNHGFPVAVDERFEYKRSEGVINVYVLWDPKSKRKATSTMRVFDMNNHAIFAAAPTKLNLNPTEHPVTSGKFDISGLTPGYYRVDIFLDAAPAWRSYFRVTE